MLITIRKLLYRFLGLNYDELKRYNDITSLSKDKYSQLSSFTYHNGAFVSRSSESPILIGKFCSIGRNVWFYVDDNNHQLSSIANSPLINKFGNGTVSEQNERWKGITIGNDVWLGADCKIMPNVNIGNGAIVGAGAIVTKDVPPYAVVAGSPAKIIKHRFPDWVISKLEKIAWWNWDWSDENIKKRVDDFYLSLNDFIEKYDCEN